MSDNKRGGPRTDANGPVDRYGGTLSVSERCELLANDCRRATLRYLADRPDQLVPVREVVDHLSGKPEFGDPESVRISLRHAHLPKLTRADVITYDRNRQIVRYVHRPEVERLLTFVADA